MEPVECRHLLVTLKTENKKKRKEKESNKKMKGLEDKIKKLKLELSSQITQ